MSRYSEEFERFWKLYPARWNRDSHKRYKVGKWDAMQEWKRLSAEEKQIAFIAVKSLRSGEFVQDAHRWLKHKRFDDIELKQKKSNEPNAYIGRDGKTHLINEKFNRMTKKLADKMKV